MSSAATALAVFYVVLWASAYVPSKIGAIAAPPLWFLVARFLCAGVVMVLVARALRRPFPRQIGQWLVYAALGVLANAAYLGLTDVCGSPSSRGAMTARISGLVLATIEPMPASRPRLSAVYVRPR